VPPWEEQQRIRPPVIGPPTLRTDIFVLEETSMAKALLGYVAGDHRRLDDNQRLRRRIADLEALVLRLQAENDALAAQLHDGELLMVPDHIESRASVRA